VSSIKPRMRISRLHIVFQAKLKKLFCAYFQRIMKIKLQVMMTLRAWQSSSND
jgi:hypothetical protein